MPSVITFGDGNTATYVYNGAGNKLSVVYYTSNGTAKMDYTGNKVYNNGTLGVILTEEGYVTPGTTPTYYYYLKDHQGNNRVVLNQGGAVQQVNHYYPFGGIFGKGLQTSKQPYKYNGKGLDRQWGLDMYDYGARHYDAALGRWFTVDPLTEKYFGILPYVYVANNPIKYIDPDRKKIKTANNTAGALKNLTMIAATSYGQIVLNKLIDLRRTYKTKSVFWSNSSKYEDQTINYVKDTWLTIMDGGYASNELFMGHEIYHAFQDDNFQIHWYKGEIGNALEMERGAVGFENYLISVYGDSPMREKYSGLRGGEKGSFKPFSFYQNSESVSYFTSLGNNEKKTSFGFCFDKKTSKSETQKHYIVVSSDDDKMFNYQIIKSEEEYKKATQNW